MSISISGSLRKVVALIAVAIGSLGCGSDSTPAPPVGEIIGRVEVSEDVSAGGCLVILEGTPLGARCDESGQFDIKNVPPGRWDLRIVTDSEANALPAKRVAAGANPGLISDLGPVRLAKAGSIGGRVLNGGAGPDLALAVIAIPSVGVVTAPNQNGGFLLADVPPGKHEVVLITEAGTAVRRDINVLPGKVTIGADLDVGTLEANVVTVTGRARRGWQESGHGGLTVELVDSLDGTVVKTEKTTDDGTFSIEAKYGTYVVRAKDASVPGSALIPSVVVRGTADVVLPAALVLHKPSDIDGDTVPDADDDDDDGDGVPDSGDAFPLDPAESQDTDGDGLGDRADLRSLGGAGVDTHNPTPDTDGDGKLDFEDNCKQVSNVDQRDGDDDDVGDACDNCPLVENADQSDSVGNGTGDACRFCRTNGDCGGGKICGQFGQCVDCLSSSQCGDRVCDSGQCVNCMSSTQCTGGDKCNLLTGRCADCLADSDCGTSAACIQGMCYQQCTLDAQCPDQYCGNGACVDCTLNAHCAPNEFCDFGNCRPQCTGNGDCIGGRVCDTTTNTCVVPCSQMCPLGEACDPMMVCREVCGSDAQCGSNQKCNAGYCGPECLVTADCTATDPFSSCQGGECVPSGLCSTDAQCAATQVCNGGSCQNRPAGLPCSSPCDCRQGETCGPAGSCVVDTGLTPTKFLAAGATGSGASVTTPSGNFSTLMAGVVSGDVIAVRADDSITTTTRASVTVGNFKLVGGFVQCAPNRWVRDPLKRSTITNTATNGQGLLRVTGTVLAPAADVAVRNLNLGVGDNTSGTVRHLEATLAPRFFVENVTFNLTPANAAVSRVVTGVSTFQSTDVRYTNLSTPGIIETGTVGKSVYLAEIVNGWGSMTAIQMGPISANTAVAAARVQGGTGDVTISDTVCGLMQAMAVGGGQLNCIVVDGLTGGKATIDGFNAQFAMGNNYSSTHAPLFLRGVALFDIKAPTGNKVALLDGLTFIDTAAPVASDRYGIQIEDSNGTAAGVTIKLPNLNGTNDLLGVVIRGPRGNVQISNFTITGGHAYNSAAVQIENVTSGIPVIDRVSYTGGTVTTRARGVYVNNVSAQPLGSFVVTDSTFNIPVNSSGSFATTQGFEVTGGVGRIERSKFITQPGYYNYGGSVVATSTVELYDSYLYAAPGSSNCVGLENRDSILYAIGNTIDGAGSPGTPNSNGFWCDNGATTIFRSNLVGGGRSPAHGMAFSGDGGACFTSASSDFDNNYFWFSAAGGQSAGDEVVLVPTNPNASNNTIDTAGSSGCYDPLGAQPDYHIISGSVCINAGLTGMRRDTSAITLDIDSLPRTLGAAPDIGASEKQ